MNKPLFSQLFGQSPFTILREHMQLSMQCADILPAYFEAIFAEDWSAAGEAMDAIVAFEHEADMTKAKLRMSLPRGLFLQVPRADVLQMIRMQDKIPNTVKDIAGVIYGRKIAIPIAVKDSFLDYVNASLEAPAIAAELIDQIDQLARSSFGGPAAKAAEQLLEQLSLAEHESDLKQVRLRQAIYAIEDQLNPVDAVILYQTTTWIGELADRAETLGNSILNLMAH